MMWTHFFTFFITSCVSEMAQKWSILGQHDNLSHKGPQSLQMAGKSRSNGESQRNTFGGTNLDAKLVRKVHLMAWKSPKNGQFGPKLPFLAIIGLIDPPWLVKVEQMVDHSGTHVRGLL